MTDILDQRIRSELDGFRRDGVYKQLNYINSPQAPRVHMEGRGEVIILSSNNYLGLSANPDVVAAGKEALDRFGAGTGGFECVVEESRVRLLEAHDVRIEHGG